NLMINFYHSPTYPFYTNHLFHYTPISLLFLYVPTNLDSLFDVKYKYQTRREAINHLRHFLYYLIFLMLDFYLPMLYQYQNKVWLFLWLLSRRAILFQFPKKISTPIGFSTSRYWVFLIHYRIIAFSL